MEYLQLTEQFKKYKVLVIGDFIVDAYFNGSCNRVAPEAPVPVVDVNHKCYCLGGAANVAANLKALGASVRFCSVTGKDESAEKGVQLLKDAGLTAELLLKDEGRQTLLKTRITTPAQTLLRYDEGSTTVLTENTLAKLLDNIRGAYATCDAVLIADYQKGVINTEVINLLVELKREKAKLIAVDSKRLNEFSALEPSLTKPNYEEAIKIVGLPYQSAGRVQQLQQAGPTLFAQTKAAVTAVTLDEEGSLLFKGSELLFHVKAPVAGKNQVSGAGDTYISACLLALCAKADVQYMADLGTSAAAIAIGKEHTALCYLEELSGSCLPVAKHISSQTSLKSSCAWYKSQGKRIVFTNGCFDILHSGHVSYLNQAKAMGDILIVGLNTDESIKRLKGSSRPVNSLANRIQVLAALSCVDHIVTFGSKKDDTPIELIKMVQPQLFVKGGDYKNTQLPEAAILNKLGCEI
uniref:PfkB family carbohydrate kinase n=1 Tax=Pedobacter sp. TaxID=1411316 RepID=UPI003D7F2379